MNFSEEEILEFKNEADDLLNSAEAALLQLESGATFKPNYDSIFRVFHSIKGGAGMLGLDVLQSHMHKIETQFSELKSRESLSKNETSFFLRSIDVSRKIISDQPFEFDYQIISSNQSSKRTDTINPKSSKATATPQTIKPTDVTSVYIVDDEAEIAEFLSDILSSAKMTTTTFTDPLKLVDAVKANIPDLVVADFKMPVMNGLGVLKAVREIDSDLPVIFVSGMLTKEILIEAINNGVAGTLEKPFRPDMVITHCSVAAKTYKLLKMLNRTMNLIVYQFSDLDDFLRSQGKEDQRQTIQSEIESLLELRRQFKIK